MIGRWLDARAAGMRLPITRWRVRNARARLAAARPPAAPVIDRPRQLLVDVSVISGHDAGTGIQRIVRAVTTLLLASPPPGYVICPVVATRKRPYRHATWGAGGLSAAGERIRIRAGDVFLGLDLSAHLIPGHFRQLADWKRQGATLHFMVYDLLPLQHPDWFSAKLVTSFRRWIEAVATLADTAVCISPLAEADLHQWLGEHYQLAPGAVPTRVIPMGWDIVSTNPSPGLPDDFDRVIARIGECSTALIVGTLEPRKGHAQVVDAFDLLWQAGKDCNLVIVGKPGWKTEALQTRLRSHPQLGKRLFWFDNASDEVLLALYRACHGVIIASLAEGFGLPLLEARGFGKPVLARDLPVFRQQAATGIDYFNATDAARLAPALAGWIDRLGNTPAPAQALPTWEDTVSYLRAWLVPKPQG